MMAVCTLRRSSKPATNRSVAWTTSAAEAAKTGSTKARFCKVPSSDLRSSVISCRTSASGWVK